MSDSEAVFDVVMRACAKQALNPGDNGGGIIGRAVAVVNALGLDGDLPMSSLKQKQPRVTSGLPQSHAKKGRTA